jgi:hypothetical protein
MQWLLILGFLFVGNMFWPKMTKTLIVAPIIGIVLGGLTWGIVAINDKSFNTGNDYFIFTGVAILIAEILVHLD